MTTYTCSSTGRDSVSAILTTIRGEVVMQFRDSDPTIEYPSCWALLAGWIEPGEDPLTAIRRELSEELYDLAGLDLQLGPVLYVGCDDREDRPWTEYIFHAVLLTPFERLRLREGESLGLYPLTNLAILAPCAPHHSRYLARFEGLIRSQIRAVVLEQSPSKEEGTMRDVHEYVAVSHVAIGKDYDVLGSGDGFVVPDTDCPTAAIHPKEEARFIAVLEFLHDTPRGNHYHLKKIEYMVILRGRLECSFSLPGANADGLVVTLSSGDVLRMLPGCVHTFTAKGGNVIALEYSPQRFEAADVIAV